MKLRNLYTLLILVLLAGSVPAQPKDLQGFLNTKWGMTESEILDAMNGKAVKLKGKKNFQFGGYATVGMPEYVIDSNKYVVHFLMNRDTEQLQAVNLDVFEQRIKDQKKYYESLKKALSKEYGEPTCEGVIENKTANIFRAAWVFPSTIILYSAWVSKINKTILQFLPNDGTKSIDELIYGKRKKN